MSHLTDIKDIEQLAALARIELEASEKETIKGELESILSYIDVIQGAVKDSSIDVISTDSSVNSHPTNILREDVVQNEGGTYSEKLVHAAPDKQDQYIKVKKILGGSQ